MAVEPWNRVNIPFPGADCRVRIPFNSNAETIVSTVLAENGNVLKLLRSEILETEIRILYELLYILNNSFRANKTFKALKQVEQCIHRLKRMQLNQALDELNDGCPTTVQRGAGVKTGECDVPSQPMLEWVCLKVLGAAELMSCTMDRCSSAFVLSRQQMNCEEFIILNLVITSLLSRLWVIFRGVLVSLSTLYQKLHELLREVALAKPMPFLTDFTLPADVAELLGPSHAALLIKKYKHNKVREEQRQQEENNVAIGNHGLKENVVEDLGVAIQRDFCRDSEMKPFLQAFKDFRQRSFKNDKLEAFKKQVKEASTFTDMAAHLDRMIKWCKSQRKQKEKCLLTFLRLKCHRMMCLEAAGYSFQRKLPGFRREAVRASSPQSPARSTRHFTSGLCRNTRRRTRFLSLKRHFRFSEVKRAARKKRPKRQRRDKSGFSASAPSEEVEKGPSTHEATPQTSDCENTDDIDDIFSSIGL